MFTPRQFSKSNDRFFMQTKSDNSTSSRLFSFRKNAIIPNVIIPYPEANRMKPKVIMQDKERLYEESLHLKNTINFLREENIKLKTKNNSLEVINFNFNDLI